MSQLTVEPLNDTMVVLTLPAQPTEHERNCVRRGLTPRIERLNGVTMVYDDTEELRIRVKDGVEHTLICLEIEVAAADYLKTRRRTSPAERSDA